MNKRGKAKYFVGWICLLAYLFIGVSSSQVALALSSAFAGPHDVHVVTDGTHQDLVLSHDHIKAHTHGHTHAHSSGHSHHHHRILAVGSHPEEHPDHVIHLSEKQEQIGTPAIALQTMDFQYLSHLTIISAVDIPLQAFFKTFSIQAFPQPPPLIRSSLAALRTIILII